MKEFKHPTLEITCTIHPVLMERARSLYPSLSLEEVWRYTCTEKRIAAIPIYNATHIALSKGKWYIVLEGELHEGQETIEELLNLMMEQDLESVA